MTLREPLNVAELHALPADEPVTMLNLMKFRARSLDGDAAAGKPTCATAGTPRRCSRRAAARSCGRATVKAVALGTLGAGDWDYAALVWYPRPSAFLDMMQSPEYALGNVHRENGTERHLILALCPTYSKLPAPFGAAPRRGPQTA